MRGRIFTLGIALACAAIAGEVSAQKAAPVVRDAVYRGTMVCGKLPFIQDPLRESIEVVVSGNSARYTRPVRAQTDTAGVETGSGNVEGGKINLRGSWKQRGDSYEASYSGSFVRRSAKLTGTQVWSHDGKSYKRECAGAIKRPLAPFLPKDRKKK